MNVEIKNSGETEQEISLLQFIHIIIKRKKFIARFCLGAALLAAVATLFMPNVYTGVAKVLPPQKDSGGVLTSLLGQMGSLASLASGSLGMGGGSSDLYVGILKSRSVADTVIKRFDLMKIYKKKKP